MEEVWSKLTCDVGSCNLSLDFYQIMVEMRQKWNGLLLRINCECTLKSIMIHFSRVDDNDSDNSNGNDNDTDNNSNDNYNI